MESDECSSSVRRTWLIKASTPLSPHQQPEKLSSLIGYLHIANPKAEVSKAVKL